MKKSSPLTPYLLRMGWRLRLRDGLILAQRTLWLAILLAGLVLLAGRVFPIERINWAWASLALWLAGCTSYALAHPLPDMHIARQVDVELNLKERLSTSLALEKEQGSRLFASFAPELVKKEHQDALRAAQAIDPARDFPLRIERRAMSRAAGLLAAALLLTFLPNPMDAVIAERKSVVEAARRQAVEIEKTRQKIETAQEMSPEERKELLRKLAELAEQLRSNPGDRQQALADLSRLDEALRQKMDPKGDQRQAALEAMAAQLQAMAKNENPQIGDLQAAAQAAEQLAKQMETMSKEEREALAQQLAEMAARAAQAGDTSLAQALAALGQAAQSGDPNAAKSAAQQTAKALQQAQSELANQRAFNQALSQLQTSRQQISGAGQPAQRAQGSGQGQGQSPGQGQGQNPGQGQGQGQAAGGGGTNASSLPPSTRTGKAGDPTGQGRDSGTGALDSQVYVPRENPQGGNGDQVFIPGQDTGEGETQSSEINDPLGGLNNPALVPYNTVYQEYLDVANQAMDQSAIPSGLKDYVREYFTQLEP
jgi:septal ring factor EnvC (AmiA/AmiB activator)